MKSKDKKRSKVRKHLCDIEVGKLHGAEISLILGQLQYWIHRNAENDHNFRDGTYWTYNTIRDWSKRMPYITYYPMKRLLRKMVDLGLIRIGNWNQSVVDRTRWYTITELGWKLLGDEPPPPPEGYVVEEEDDDSDDGNAEPVLNSTNGRCRKAPASVQNSTNCKCRKASSPVRNSTGSIPNRGTVSHQSVQNSTIAMCKTAPVPVTNSTSTGAKLPRTGAKVPPHTNRNNGTTTNQEQKKNLRQAEFPKSAEADYRVSAVFDFLGFAGTGNYGDSCLAEFIHDSILLQIRDGLIDHSIENEVDASFEYEKWFGVPPANEPRRGKFYTETDNHKPLRSEPLSNGTSKPIHSEHPVSAKRSGGTSEPEENEIGNNNHAENATPKMRPPEPLFRGANETARSAHPIPSERKKVYSAAEKKEIAYYAFIEWFDHDDPDINGAEFAKYFSRFDEEDYERFDKKRQAETGLLKLPRSESATKPPPDNTTRTKPPTSEPATELCYDDLSDFKKRFTEPWYSEEYEEYGDDDCQVHFREGTSGSYRSLAWSHGVCPDIWGRIAVFKYRRITKRKDRSMEDFETNYLPFFTIEDYREYYPLWELRRKYRAPTGGMTFREYYKHLRQQTAEKTAKLATEKAAEATETEIVE